MNSLYKSSEIMSCLKQRSFKKFIPNNIYSNNIKIIILIKFLIATKTNHLSKRIIKIYKLINK